MKLAIIGSRSFLDYTLMCKELAPYKPKISEIISGGAKGADTLGERWAKENNIKTLIFLADWSKGKGAGIIRNHDIIKNCDGVIAFWDGKSTGTGHAITIAEHKYNKPCKIIIVK